MRLPSTTELFRYESSVDVLNWRRKHGATPVRSWASLARLKGSLCASQLVRRNHNQGLFVSSTNDKLLRTFDVQCYDPDLMSGGRTRAC